MREGLKQRIKRRFHETMNVEASPHSIALGFAMGALIAVLPTFGFGLLIGLLVLLIFKKLNKFALFIGLAVFNPVVLIPIYYLSFKIGAILFAHMPLVTYDIALLDKVYRFSRRFLVGNFILSTILTSASYFLVRLGVVIYRKNKNKNVRK